MREKTAPCVYYTCAGADCMKGKKAVTMAKCQHCKKYQPRKTGNPKEESIRSKREKAYRKDAARYMKEV